MSKQTPATAALAKAGHGFEPVRYDYDPDADSIGLHAAAAIGEAPRRVLKTLIIEVDGRPACVVIPSDHALSLKLAAAAFGGKAARMAQPKDAERITGYRVGGVSPFGQRRGLPTAIEATAMAESHVFVNGGQRGLQLRIAPATVVEVAGAIVADLVAER
jgi:Cys-tRNA(Pro)/Cys-tRNA(Cys) deacylase